MRWRRRLDLVRTAIGRRSKRGAAAAAGVLGLDELVLGAGLVLITVALWPLVGRVALLVPGLALTFLSFPTRAPFVHQRPTPPKAPPTRR
jgi:hypothetical protein